MKLQGTTSETNEAAVSQEADTGPVADPQGRVDESV